MPQPAYAELQCLSAFSFLRGASHAEELAATAAALGHAGLGLADINTAAGVVRAHAAAKRDGLRLLVGSRLAFRDETPDLVCYPTDRAAWGQMTRLLTRGKSRAAKGDCALVFDDLPAHAAGQAVLVVPPPIWTLASAPPCTASATCSAAPPGSPPAAATATTSRGCARWRGWRGWRTRAACRWSPPTTCSTTPRSGALCKTS